MDLENRNFDETSRDDDLNSYGDPVSPIIKNALTKVMKNIKI